MAEKTEDMPDPFWNGFMEAVKEQKMACVKRLLPRVDVLAHDSLAFRHAVQMENDALIALLLPMSNPQAGRCFALRWMAEQGNIKWVQALLPVSDPTVDGSMAVRVAALQWARLDASDKARRERYHMVVDLLLPVSNFEDVAHAFLRHTQSTNLNRQKQQVWKHLLQPWIDNRVLHEMVHAEQTHAVTRIHRKM